ncbi:hypothetical protein [Glaciimonas immobilis]|uniref:Uncharacterized protein n=1 Tax=Glaciimonas immobilis TaxID=728004 RepID=A0A840RSE4_9BURK|nr:hypothetical protein [Glaciimonas immobilis]MBB5199938.1 hypothetical protein [Glaciimonas immobilis]
MRAECPLSGPFTFLPTAPGAMEVSLDFSVADAVAPLFGSP